MKRKIQILSVVLSFFVFASCTRCSHLIGKAQVVSVGQPIYCVSYNTQTFFDAIEDGREFREFKGHKTKWTPELYKTRLLRLREAGELSVQMLGGPKNTMPDIFVMQEVESTRVIEDFAKLFSRAKGYDHAVFFPPTGKGSFSTAIFSKFPIVDFEQFTLNDSRFETKSLRPLVKATVEIDTGRKCEYVTIFAVHWKSKLGDDTDLIRDAQEQQLLTQVQHTLAKTPDMHVLMCGDFNQTAEEFKTLPDTFNDAWQLDFYTQKNASVDGSYFYRGNWEQIDHLFLSESLYDNKGLEITDFSPVAITPLLKTNGQPNEFRLSNGAGYSDHLPLCWVLEFCNDEQ